jgi:hypothetical protein
MKSWNSVVYLWGVNRVIYIVCLLFIVVYGLNNLWFTLWYFKDMFSSGVQNKKHRYLIKFCYYDTQGVYFEIMLIFNIDLLGFQASLMVCIP